LPLCLNVAISLQDKSLSVHTSQSQNTQMLLLFRDFHPNIFLQSLSRPL
jgi:hypothetical protein